MKTLYKMAPAAMQGAGAAAPVALPLDNYTDNLIAAYSVRRLLTAYEGNCIRIRQGTSGGEQNFGFDENDILDRDAIITFLGGETGLVVTWFDQSGNGNNAQFIGSGGYPSWIANSLGGRDVVRHVSSDYFTTPFTLGAAHSYIAVVDNVGAGAYGLISGDTTDLLEYLLSSNQNFSADNTKCFAFVRQNKNSGTEYRITRDQPAGAFRISFVNPGNAQPQIRVNNELGTNTANTATATGTGSNAIDYLGAGVGGTRIFIGDGAEHIFYDAEISSVYRDGIDASESEHFFS